MYPLNHKSLSHQTWPIDRYKQGNNFKNFGGPGLSFRSFSIKQAVAIIQ